MAVASLTFFDKKSLLLLLKCECIQKVQFRMNVSPFKTCSFPLHFCQRISACFPRAEGEKRGANLSFAKSLRSPQKRRRIAMLRKTLFYTHVCGTGRACQDAVQGQEKKGSVVVHSSRRSCLDSENSKKKLFMSLFPGNNEWEEEEESAEVRVSLYRTFELFPRFQKESFTVATRGRLVKRSGVMFVRFIHPPVIRKNCRSSEYPKGGGARIRGIETPIYLIRVRKRGREIGE